MSLIVFREGVRVIDIYVDDWILSFTLFPKTIVISYSVKRYKMPAILFDMKEAPDRGKDALGGFFNMSSTSAHQNRKVTESHDVRRS